MTATKLGSAPPPPPGPGDHVRGPPAAPVVVEYGDFECHFCRLVDVRLTGLALRRVFRHFPVRSSHPRAWPAACAAEAAAGQGAFWEMHDSLYSDQGRLDDPHLWQRARDLGLDLERFDVDRRSPDVEQRVRRDFLSGMRAGVVTTPTLFVGGVAHPGMPDEDLLRRLAASPGAA